MKEYKMGLCAGRHVIPGIDSYIFPETVSPTDFAELRDIAWENIPSDAETLHIYVTGLTAAMLAVVSVCQVRGISLVGHHYDRESGNYLPQTVLAYETCPFCHERMSAYDRYCGNCGSN